MIPDSDTKDGSEGDEACGALPSPVPTRVRCQFALISESLTRDAITLNE